MTSQQKEQGESVRYKGLWFWSPKDTIAHSEMGSYHPRELYIGDEHDSVSVHYNNSDSIIDKCNVRVFTQRQHFSCFFSHLFLPFSLQVRYFDNPSGKEFDDFIKGPASFFYRFKYSDERFAFPFLLSFEHTSFTLFFSSSTTEAMT